MLRAYVAYLCCLTRDRWASHRLGSMVKRNVCESDVQPQILGLQADMNSEGTIRPIVCAPSWVWVEWACLCSRLNHQYYLYNLRGLTGLGLVLFHPNIIILWKWHNWIGDGNLWCYYICKLPCWIHVYNCLWCNCVVTCLNSKCLFLVHP